VSDQAGNPATAATRTVSYDRTAPSLSIGTVSGDDRINDAEDESAVTIAGTTSGAEDGRVVSVTVGTVTQTATVSAGAWTTSLTSSQVKSLSEGSVTVTANVSDQAGNPATAATRTVSYDRTAPSLSIGTVSGDDRINDAEDESAVTIAGTTSGAEDGRVVSVTVGTVTQTATVSAGAWTTSLTSSQVKSLSEGSVTVTANVSDQAGNPATAATRTVSYDRTAPSLSIGTVSGDDRINDAEDESAVTIAGTTSGAEDGRVVSVTVGTVTQTATVSAGAWTTSLTSSQVKSLSEGSVTITASVSDQAGNPATAATKTITYDKTAPTVSIGTVSTDDRINDAEDESAVTIAGTT
ncbi:Ig-like domain-containing protein, partial [Azospirillum isscasi]